MSATECWSKCLLIFVNVIFIINGLTILAAGIFLLVGTKYFEDTLSDLNDNIDGLASGAGVQATVNGDGVDLDLTGIVKVLAIVLIILGAFVLIMGLLGCIGAIASNKCMLITYATIVFLLFAAMCAAFICLMTGVFDDKAKEKMTDWIKDDYVGIDDLTTHSIIWNFIMIELKCCGIEDYTDFTDASKWKSNRTNEAGQEMKLKTPIACCKTQGSFPNVEIDDEECATNPTEATSNYKVGCWEKLREKLDDQQTNLIIYFTISFVLMVGCGGLAIVIVVKNRRTNDGKNYHY